MLRSRSDPWRQQLHLLLLQIAVSSSHGTYFFSCLLFLDKRGDRKILGGIFQNVTFAYRDGTFQTVLSQNENFRWSKMFDAENFRKIILENGVECFRWKILGTLLFWAGIFQVENFRCDVNGMENFRHLKLYMISFLKAWTILDT